MTIIPHNIITCILSHRPHLRFLVERKAYRDLASNYLRGESRLSLADTNRLAMVSAGMPWQ